MAGVHCGEEVETLRTTNFAQDDPVRAHTQCVLHKVTDGDGAIAFQVRRARFKREPMRLLQPKFGGIFNRQNALARVNHFGQSVQHRRFT